LVIDEEIEFTDVDVESFCNLDIDNDRVNEFELFADDSQEVHSMPEADKWDGEAFDKFIAAEVLVPKGDMLEHGKVV
jgi:hypothetical protein